MLKNFNNSGHRFPAIRTGPTRRRATWGRSPAVISTEEKIRTHWDAENEEWYFSVVDVVGVLTEQSSPRNASTYWAVLKKRLKQEGAGLRCRRSPP